MNGFPSDVYYTPPNFLGTIVYGGASSVVDCVRSNPITTFGLLGIGWAAGVFGQVISITTKKYVQLNNFVPMSLRNGFRRYGENLADYNERITDLILKVLPVRKDFFQKTITSPILEELEFRLPLLLASWKIDNLHSEFFYSPLLEGAVDTTFTQLIMVALAVLSSIAFTYAHDEKPDVIRASDFFAGGLALAYLTLHPDGGLLCAIIAHMIHNLPLSREAELPLRYVEHVVLEV